LVTPEVEMKYSKLKLDGTKFEKTNDSTFLGVVSYSNSVEGIIYTVDHDEVTEITYRASQKDCRRMLQKARSKMKS